MQPTFFSGPQHSCLVVGLNSGTSMDGVDSVLLQISETAEPEASSKWVLPRIVAAGATPLSHPIRGSVSPGTLQLTPLAFLTHPYPASLKEELLRVSVGGGVEQVCRYNVLLGKVFAEAARGVVSRAGREMAQVSLVGSHG